MIPVKSSTQRPSATMSALVEQLSQSRSNTRIHGSVHPYPGEPSAVMEIPFESLELPQSAPSEVE